ncbi:long-chain fatty acid--CoA ligase [Bradyrhizobium sp. U87765 SZCCT0131]|uniref:long-chain-fatty-acid--CoA ligase n=1 Tax=unclassified Bradyrhizobium TaxID=2631580 RepID=UPI001BA9C663|nr:MULTISPECIES: long-chain fatty acid--CoA ligase [unclassified Bradyrhizobium]MBR1222014.1 long-chain fatty acid--CoA ligase [Bradyrhizobium sp. U87765 SZCCT0131]MBR1263788.1 long-chain fatty acid--CoA ligase [Bradyrhizobium sp. U87765 SZCCT0134]MBR1302642.1 long-chain fatty acid--CoA ligase [Bradyrhizobium sp. U87765 SZCCT0110]MBR1320038.1 long-chain fatty acid--CoA ligase [Bradyrhizobium sp. U87765 SZCCT0109]MBR1348849.1 long-chain fatty acid--CoA ligase [Bradyrhizobium sp. U87765 SZCCT004
MTDPSLSPLWIKSYPPGVRWNAEIPVMPVQQILEDAAAQWPDQPAVEFMGRRISYRELDALASRAAKGFQMLGVGPGVHVGLYLPNTPHYLISFFGVLKAGGTVVNYSPLDAAKVLEHKVEDSETDVMVTLDLALLYPQMARLLDTTRLKTLVVGDLAEMTGHPEAVRGQLAAGQQLATVTSDDRHRSFQSLLDHGADYRRHPIADPADALAVLQYTGGTTGLPKGAMLTHGNLTAAVSQCVETTRTEPPVLDPGHERILAVLPPFHIYALTVNMLLGLRIGAELVLHTRFDAATAIKDISEKKITAFPGVPTMFVAILNHPSTATADLRSLKWCNSGGAPLPLEVQQAFEKLTGCRLAEGWGMTETSPTGTYTPVPGPQKQGSCGVPSPGISFKFLSVEDGRSYVAQGERGELCVRGANIMKGYWKKPEATAAIMTEDGYMRTGDVGYMDADGYIYIVDRTKDMLLCGGFNVYPRTIEEAIYTHPAVEEVSVIGIHDAYRGQSPKAFIKLKQGAAPFTLEELKAFLADKLGKHEMVSAIDIRPELPKTAVGKLSKKELYEEEERKRAGASAA